MSTNIQNLKTIGESSFHLCHTNTCASLSNQSLTVRFCFALDPFADAFRSDETGAQDGLIHIRIQQRNGRKTLTTVQGIADNFDKKKIVKACKKVCLVVTVQFIII